MSEPIPFPFAFNPDSPEIHILVNPRTKDLTVIPTVAHLREGAQVTWTLWVEEAGTVCKAPPDAAVLLTFRDFHAVHQTDVRQERDRTATATACKAGRYHYRVMVAVKGTIVADIGCPSMEIRPR